ncbi:MAG TPA: hypothetical protein VLG48_12745 [Candidatus Methylomirabilis sp.]|nr:hypothetical protein [Candidatus Methylomirabilis sp.]
MRRRLRLASAKADLTLQEYVREAVEDRLREDLDDDAEGVLALAARSDPILAELWDNCIDAGYDRL